MRGKYLGGFGAAILLLAAVGTLPVGAAETEIPKTGFERSAGSAWTTWPEERSFLRAVDRRSKRVVLETIGRSDEGRALRLVRIGAPRPHSADDAREQPTVLFVCSQHGDEPAAREACLMLIRDLAFTYGRNYVKQLRTTTVLVMPSANPDGLVAGTSDNTQGVNVSRDHLNLRSPEARAVARVAIDWRPDVVLDLHDAPADDADADEVLYGWPRDLNVDERVHDLAMRVGTDYLEVQAKANGYSSSAADPEALDEKHRPVHGDEGTLTNNMGLRHALGSFVLSTVHVDGEGAGDDPAAVARRRVDSHTVSLLATLQFLRREGDEARRTTAGAARRKTAEGRDQSAPVYFDGADDEAPREIQDPPPCAYVLTDRQFQKVGDTMALLDIAALGSMEGVFVPMGQPAEPLIPLLLDARGWRHEVAADPQMSC